MKQFIKNKPINTGVKYYFMTDPKTGFTFSVLMHHTNDVFPYAEIHGKRFALTWAIISGLSVVGGLCYLDCGHSFYFDRFYTSVELFYEMLNRKTYAVGECEI